MVVPESKPLELLLAGLDYNTGRAVSLVMRAFSVKEDDRREAGLTLAISYLGQAIALKTERKHAIVPGACRSYRHACIENGGDQLALNALDIIESYAPAIMVRKLRDRVRLALRESREPRLPGH